MRIINEDYDIFTAHPSNATGSSLVGYLENVTRSELEQTFGTPWEYEPDHGDGKITTEWIITIDGELATIYDWKRSEAPDYNERITWHVGGFSRSVWGYINSII